MEIEMKYLAIITASITIGTFLYILFVDNRNKNSLSDSQSKKLRIVMAALAAICIISIVTYVEEQRSALDRTQHIVHIKWVTDEIHNVLDAHSMTFDQLYDELYFVNYSDLNEALTNMIKGGSLGHKNLDVRDDKGGVYKVKAFYHRQSEQGR